MTWVKITDIAFEDPRLEALDAATVLLPFEALAYSSRNGLDGHLTHVALRRSTRHPDPEAGARALVDVGIWGQAPDGFQIIWLLDDQRTAADLARTKAETALRTRRWKAHKAGDHSLCDYCSAKRKTPGDASADALTVASADAAHSPVPSTPKGVGTGDWDRAAGATAGGASVPAPDDDLFPCDRCGIRIDGKETKWISDPDDDANDAAFCPTCAIAHRWRKGLCIALKKSGEPCGTKATGEGLWCLFHNTPSKRGVNPALGQRAIDKIRAKKP
jgi:hypothetical protein